MSIEIGKFFQFSCVEYKKIPYTDVDDYLIKVRSDYGYEGVVLYFLDSDLNTIGLLKKKTTWYIIIRAIREKLRSYVSAKSTQTLEDLKQKVFDLRGEFKVSILNINYFSLKKKISKRLKNIQAWIGFATEDLQKWQTLSFRFAEWFNDLFRNNRITHQDYSEKFPVLW